MKQRNTSGKRGKIESIKDQRKWQFTNSKYRQQE